MREAKIQKDKEVNSQESRSSESSKIRKAPHQRLDEEETLLEVSASWAERPERKL